MGAAMEAHFDFGRCNGDIGGHVDEIAKDLAGLGSSTNPSQSRGGKADPCASSNSAPTVHVSLIPVREIQASAPAGAKPRGAPSNVAINKTPSASFPKVTNAI